VTWSPPGGPEPARLLPNTHPARLLLSTPGPPVAGSDASRTPSCSSTTRFISPMTNGLATKKFTNNVMALAFRVLIVFLMIGGSIWIMANLNHWRQWHHWRSPSGPKRFGGRIGSDCLLARSSAGEDNLRRFDAPFDCLGSGRATKPRIFGAVEAHGDVQDHCIGRGNAATRPGLQQGPYRGI
jgi:hypothetical protein